MFFWRKTDVLETRPPIEKGFETALISPDCLHCEPGRCIHSMLVSTDPPLAACSFLSTALQFWVCHEFVVRERGVPGSTNIEWMHHHSSRSAVRPSTVDR